MEANAIYKPVGASFTGAGNEIELKLGNDIKLTIVNILNPRTCAKTQKAQDKILRQQVK